MLRNIELKKQQEEDLKKQKEEAALDEMLRNIELKKQQEEDLKKQKEEEDLKKQKEEAAKQAATSQTQESLFPSQTGESPEDTDSETTSSQEIKTLLDNSIAEMKRLGLDITSIAINGLTKDQANSLTKDILTYELQKIGMFDVLAPKIYLSQNTLKLLNNSGAGAMSGTTSGNIREQQGMGGSVIAAAGNLSINSPSADLLNKGSIISGKNMALNLNNLTNKTNSTSQAEIKSGNNLAISANTISNQFGNITSNNDLNLTANNITNYHSNIASGNDLSLVAIDDIKNIGANIIAINNLKLTSLSGNILNSAIVQTNDDNLLASNSDSYQLAKGDYARRSGNIRSTLLQTAAITGGNVEINAAKDFTNLAANISTQTLFNKDSFNQPSFIQHSFIQPPLSRNKQSNHHRRG